MAGLELTTLSNRPLYPTQEPFPSSNQANPGYTGESINLYNNSLTNANVFQSLIQEIRNNITSNTAQLKVNNTIFDLNGPQFDRKYSEINTTSPITNLLHNTLTNAATSILTASGKTFQTPYVNLANSVLKSNEFLNKPNVTINLSSEGFLPNKPIDLTKFTPSATLVKDGWNELGKKIDKQIKDTFITQLFGIKGTDLMCAGICILFALLPCKVNNEIVDALQTIRNYQAMVKSSVSMVNNFNNYVSDNVNSSFGSFGPIAGIGNIQQFKSTMTDAFNGLKTHEPIDLQKAFSIVNTSIKAASVILKTINMLISIIRIGLMDMKKIWAWIEGGLYDLLNNVLFALQAMAVKMANKIFNQLIAPLEKQLKNIIPDKCGTLAKIFFAKIMQVIYNFKNKLLQFIGDLFSFMKIEHTKFELFNNDAPWVLQLSAFLKLFNILLDNFLDIAIGCMPVKRFCPENGIFNDPNTTNTPNPYNDTALDMTNSLSGLQSVGKAVDIKPLADLPKSDNLDELSEKLKDQIKMIYPDKTINIGPNRTTIKELGKMPPLIIDILNNSELGPGVTIYQDPLLNDTKMVYENPAFCGA
jgi:hypothetical protein